MTIDTPTHVPKGELMEELIRIYFLKQGFYVLRSCKFKYQQNDVTDVDLYLYGRSSSVVRQRINVDIKNKKSPQAYERVLWANGLKSLLRFDSCIVATTDTRPAVVEFGRIHNTIVLNGIFLQKLKSPESLERVTEDQLCEELQKLLIFDNLPYKDCKILYESSKSRLLTSLDFSGANENLLDLKYIIEMFITGRFDRFISLRLIYILMSHFLIIMDYLSKDLAFLDPSLREKNILEGFNYGSLGREGVSRIFSIASKLVHMPQTSIEKVMENGNTLILKDFFSKNENMNSAFKLAIEFEKIAYHTTPIAPENLEPHLKSMLFVLLDFFDIERNRILNLLTRS